MDLSCEVTGVEDYCEIGGIVAEQAFRDFEPLLLAADDDSDGIVVEISAATSVHDLTGLG